MERKNDVKGNQETTFDLSAFDGRYSEVVQRLQEYFSEYALVKNKVKLELFWIKFCAENMRDAEVLKNFDKKKAEEIIKIYRSFSYTSYKKIKKMEKRTGNQLQAMENFIEEELKKVKLKNLIGLVNMDCSIENINDISYASMIATGIREAWIPTAENLVSAIADMQLENDDIHMISHDETENEKLTTLGREMLVYAYRFSGVLKKMGLIKIGPAAETLLDKSSPVLSRKFINECLGLYLNSVEDQYVVQDYMVEIADAIRHFNNILLEFNNDLSSIEHFSSTQKPKFENSEADINISNLFMISISNRVNASQRARELSDFYTQKNVVLAFGYSMQAIERTIAQINSLTFHEDEEFL